MVYIEKLESPQAVRMTSRIGTRVTLYSSAVGKAYLAALDEASCTALLTTLSLQKFTEHTITDKAALHAEIAATRHRGYAEDREENEAQIFCIGAAIRNQDNQVLGCISISIPLYRKLPDLQTSYVAPLLETCRAVTRKLYSQGPVNDD